MDTLAGDAASMSDAEPDAQPTADEEPALLVIDVSGADGRAGRDGTSYAGVVAQYGYHGRPGGDAGESQPGEPAGDIELVLRADDRSPDMLELEGRRTVSSRRVELVRQRLVIGERGYVRLLACGGRGGHGGRGGDGEVGGRGIDGVDATQRSSGGDGSAGGRGGDGGTGTSGAAGGDGGRITVQVDARDTDLLMLIQARADGGAGGEAGANGAGGEGGPGGAGGASYSWTTTSTEYRTDAQGRPQPHTVHHHHRNPGGQDGPRGARGRDGSARLQPGRPGAAGHVHLLVQNGTHVTQYAERYELEITGYDLQLEDLCAEPTSRLVVSNIAVRNGGGMPTPHAQPPQVLLRGGRWVEPDAQRLSLPVVLDVGASHAFTQETLTARVPELDDVPVGDPLRVTVHIDPLAVQSRVNRPFANRHPRQEFTVAFPAELAAVKSLESQTPGQAAWLRVDIQNCSRHDLGSTSASQRVVGVRIQLANAELAPHLMLLDPQGQPIAWHTGYHTEIPLLAAGQIATVRTILGILPGAPRYTKAALFVTLELGQRHAPHEPRDRHRREYPVRVARAYEFDPTADILLITHHSTTPEELQAWEEAAAAIGQKINVWDISLNDSLSLSDELAHGQNLLRDLHGKTIILSNAPFQTALGTRYADQFLSQMDLIKAAASHDIRLLIVNDVQRDLNHLFHERLIPTDGEPEYRYGSIKSFLRSEPLEDVEVLFNQVDELVRHGAKAARPDPLRQTSDIDLYGIRSPNARRLRRQAVALQRALQHRAPGRRVVVTYRLPSELTPAEQQARDDEEPHSGIFFTHEYQGTLTVMPTLGDHHPNLIVISANAAMLHQPGFVTSPGVRSALLQALRFEEKVYLLSDKLRALGESARIDPQSLAADELAGAQLLVDAILIDLATEQAAALQTRWQPLFFGDTLRQSLVQLRFLADHPFPLVAGDRRQPDVQLAARLVAGVAFLGVHASRWYDSRWWPWGWFCRGPVVRDEYQRQTRQLASNLFRTASSQQQPPWQEALRQYETQLQAFRREHRGVGKREAAREVLQAPLVAGGVRTDVGRAFPGVLAYREWDAVREAETQREAARVALKEEKERQRAECTVVRSGRAVPGVAPEVASTLEPFLAACRTAYAQQDRQHQEMLRQRAAERGAAGPPADLPSRLPPVSTQEID